MRKIASSLFRWEGQNSFPTERYQMVNLSTCISDWIQLYQGVPQWTVLGPLFFNIHVNDMQQSVMENCDLIQYADDTMIFSPQRFDGSSQ